MILYFFRVSFFLNNLIWCDNLKMVIFNQTFTNDKPIYFPDNWHTGKNQMQIYAEWKTGTEFFIYTNIFQIIAASAFIIMMTVLVLAAKELVRLSRLDDRDNEKINHRRYLKASFIVPLGLVGLMCLSLMIFVVLREEWTQIALLKGFIFCIGCYLTYRGSQVIPKQWKKTKNSLKKRFPQEKTTHTL